MLFFPETVPHQRGGTGDLRSIGLQQSGPSSDGVAPFPKSIAAS
jgi:hypothetical protein